jgi:hypothetical protein
MKRKIITDLDIVVLGLLVKITEVLIIQIAITVMMFMIEGNYVILLQRVNMIIQIM